MTIEEGDWMWERTGQVEMVIELAPSLRGNRTRRSWTGLNSNMTGFEFATINRQLAGQKVNTRSEKRVWRTPCQFLGH
jgi:hypothetical protein